MRKFFKRFITSPLLWGSSIFAFLLTGLHIYQFIDSGFAIQPLIRIIFCGAYPFIVFFFGSQAIPFIFLIFGYIIEQFANFTNYTSFLIVIMFIILHPKAQIPCIALYIVDVVIVCMHHNKDLVHFIIHIVNCAFIFFASNKCLDFYHKNYIFEEKKLILDEVDVYILNELASGARQKEIKGYSENTVSKRLKKCRELNNCASNSELLLKFLHQSNKSNHKSN